VLAFRGKTRRFQMKFRNTVLGWTVPKRALDWRSEDCDVTCILLFVDFSGRRIPCNPDCHVGATAIKISLLLSDFWKVSSTRRISCEVLGEN
jgi:hypothetical protein